MICPKCEAPAKLLMPGLPIDVGDSVSGIFDWYQCTENCSDFLYSEIPEERVQEVALNTGNGMDPVSSIPLFTSYPL